MSKIKQGDYVLFFYDDSKKWLLKIKRKEQFHSHIGIIKHADAIGKEFGSRLITVSYTHLTLPTICSV